MIMNFSKKKKIIFPFQVLRKMAPILKEFQLVDIFTPIDLSTADYNPLETLKSMMTVKDCLTK